MDRTHNIFISHHGKDDEHVQHLKKRLRDGGSNIRNSSIDSTKHTTTRPKNIIVARLIRRRIRWAGTFICLIGENTHTRPWVNYEIKQAHLQGKQIIGIYKYGCANSVELPEAFKKYGGSTIGWNSLDKLDKVMSGEITLSETPTCTNQEPIYNIIRVHC